MESRARKQNTSKENEIEAKIKVRKAIYQVKC